MISNKGQDDNNYVFDNEGDEEEEQENPDDVGFEKRIKVDVGIFLFKNIDLPGVPKSEKIKKYIVSEETKIIVTQTNKILRWRTRKDPEFIAYELPDPSKENFIGLLMKGKEKQLVIRNVYLDPRGIHCIITTENPNPNNFYFNYRSSKIKNLPKIKNLNINCLAFYNPDSENTTGQMVIANDNGIISLYKVDYRDDKDDPVQTIVPSVLQLPTPTDILGIQIYSKLNQNVGGKYLITLFTTNSSIFCITGPDDIGLLFDKFKDKNEKIKEMPMPRGYNSVGQTCYSKYTKRPSAYIWTNGNSLLSFKIPEANERITDNFLGANQALKYAKKTDLDDRKAYTVQEMPTNIGITDFHYYILHQESLTIMSRITQKIIKYWEFKNGTIIDMVFQKATRIFWIYSSTAVVKLDTSQQDNQVVAVLIEKKRFPEAFKVAKETKENLEYVAGLYADDLFAKKQYQAAATLYVDTARTFQEIFIKFFTADSDQSREGLETYIKAWLKKLQPQQKTQKCLLISWLIELIVYKLNNLERQMKHNTKSNNDIKNLIKLKEQQLDVLLTQNLDVIDENLVYSIMQSHGRINNIVKFAEKKNNFQMIILHHINEENFKTAINNLKRVKDKRVVDVVNKYAHIFFREEIQETTELLTKSIQDFKPVKLIAGFMNIPAEKRAFGIQLLKYSIQELKCRDKSIHNILIFFYATTKKENKEQVVELIKNKLNFDVEFGLRLFKRHHMYEAQIVVYGMMNLYGEAVNLALENGKFNLAKTYANMPQYDDVKKKLWLQIAKNLLHQGKNVKQVITLTKQSKVIKIEDLLPFFNQSIKIEDFKDEICDSLKAYSSEIQRLKKQMESYSANAQQLKNQLRTIKNRCIQIDSSNKCEECYKSLFNEEFYIFPCMHGFHRECLFDTIKVQPTTDREKIERIESLSKQINTLKGKIMQKKKQTATKQNSSSFSFNMFNIFGAGKKSEQDENLLSLNKQEQQIKGKKEQFDDLLASECIYCGPSIVDTITMPFDDEKVKNSWRI